MTSGTITNNTFRGPIAFSDNPAIVVSRNVISARTGCTPQFSENLLAEDSWRCSSTNVLAQPILAADGYHLIPGSPGYGYGVADNWIRPGAPKEPVDNGPAKPPVAPRVPTINRPAVAPQAAPAGDPAPVVPEGPLAPALGLTAVLLVTVYWFNRRRRARATQ
jgi:hypothetical protein